MQNASSFNHRFILLDEILNLITFLRKIYRPSLSVVASIALSTDENTFQSDLFSDSRQPKTLASLNCYNNESVQSESNIELEIIRSFLLLKEYVIKAKDIENLNAYFIIDPFSNVIALSNFSGLITSKALNATRRILSLGIINTRNPDYEKAIEKLYRAVSQCRFEALDSARDEYVLFSILKNMEILLSSSHELLDPGRVSDLFETIFAMCCQSRLSDFFRRTACDSLISSIRYFFGNGANLRNEALPALISSAIKMLNLENEGYTESGTAVSLRMLLSIIETAGQKLASNENVCNLLAFDAMPPLILLTRSQSQSLVILTLRLIRTIICITPHNIRNQIEIFFRQIFLFCFPAIVKSNIPEFVRKLWSDIYDEPKFNREANSNTLVANTAVSTKSNPKIKNRGIASNNVENILEQLYIYLHIPDFLITLFVLYDCDTNSIDVCQEFISIIARNVLTDQTIPCSSFITALSLESLLYIPNSLLSILNSNSQPDTESQTNVDLFIENYNRKLQLKEAYKIFNSKPKEGAKYFRKIFNITDENIFAKEMAQFLKDPLRINHKLVGDYLATPSNSHILVEYLNLFNFDNLQIDEALRQMMQCFRLPGEAQQIERIVEKFSERYVNCKHVGSVYKADSLFVLSYAIILLNVDLHSPKVKKRMTFDQFQSNLRGLNEGQNFPEEFLLSIFQNIQSNEIIIAEEHDSTKSFEILWQRQIVPPGRSTSQDDSIYSQVINGLNQCLEIAELLDLPFVADSIISSISNFSNLQQPRFLDISINVQVETQEKLYTISPLSVNLGRDFKSQLAIVVFFRLCYNHEYIINEGWKNIFQIIKYLFVNDLISPTLSPIHQITEIDPLPYPNTEMKVFIKKSQEKGESNGLFSALSLYIANYSDDPEMPSDEDLESSICLYDCIKCCKLDLLIKNMLKADSRTTYKILDALISTRDLQVTDIHTSDAFMNLIGTAKKEWNINDYFDFFKLEFALSLVIKDPSILQAKGWLVIKSIMTSICLNDPILTIRPMLYLLRILRAQEDFALEILKSEYLCELLNEIPEVHLVKHGHSLVYALLMCLRADKSSRLIQSPEFFAFLFRVTVTSVQSEKLIFDILCIIVSRNLSLMTFADISSLINVLANQESSIYTDFSDYQFVNSKSSEVVHHYGYKAVEKLQDLFSFLKEEAFLIEHRSLAFDKYYKPFFLQLLPYCFSKSRNIRQVALRLVSELARAFCEMEKENKQILLRFFDEILLSSFYDELQGSKILPHQASYILTDIIGLWCRLFLQYILESQYCSNDTNDTWQEPLYNILKLINQLLLSFSNDHLLEAATENVKNIVLILKASNRLSTFDIEKGESIVISKIKERIRERFASLTYI